MRSSRCGSRCTPTTAPSCPRRRCSWTTTRCPGRAAAPFTAAGWRPTTRSCSSPAEAALSSATPSRLHDGPDDTFAVGARYAELYSLSVAPEARGGGVGTALMDALDERLTELGIADLSIAVMAGNEDALRFYRRRGLVPVEVVLWRVPS